jgi:Flavin containing amine oxidoreductase
MKIFLEFADSFFSGRGFCLDSLGSCIDDDGEQLFWDFTSVNGPLESGNTILTGFILGDRSEPLIDLADEIILQRVLDLLDDEFDGMASISFVKGFVKNWSKDPNFLGALSSCGYDCYDESRSGAQALDDKVWIAGEAFPIDGNNGWVDAGAFSGDDAAKQILRRKDGISVPNTLFWVRVRDDLESATPSPSIRPNPPPTPNPTLPLTPIPTSNPILPPIPNPTRPPTPPPTPFPTSSPVLAPTPTPVPVSCTLNAIECVANSDCCSQRCFSRICRVASGGDRDRDGLKISFGQAGGAAEDRNPLIGGQRGNIYAGFGI